MVRKRSCAGVRGVRGTWRDKAHLACGIPDLKLNLLTAELDSANLEVDTDCRDVALSIGVVCETEKQARLAHTRITDEKQLEEVIAVPSKQQASILSTMIAYYSVFMIEKGCSSRGHAVRLEKSGRDFKREEGGLLRKGGEVELQNWGETLRLKGRKAFGELTAPQTQSPSTKRKRSFVCR